MSPTPTVLPASPEPVADAVPAGDRRVARLQALIDAALAALRAGTHAELLRQRPLLTRWATRRFVGIVRGAVGDALDGREATAEVATLLLGWLVTQLRPDLAPGFDDIDEAAWLQLTGWRPMLSVACHAGLLPVPEFRARYRRRPDEAAIDNLCGLWNVGVSTFYRYQERGKHAMAQLLADGPAGAAQRLALREFAAHEATRRLGLDAAARAGWHAAQGRRALLRHDAAAALWHSWRAGDVDGCIAMLRDHASSLAADPEALALLERVSAAALPPRQRFDLWLARAAIARTRNEPEREWTAYDKALQVAHDAGDRLMLGMVYGMLGRFHEPRDTDRAFACYQESAEFLRDHDTGTIEATALEQYLTTLTRLAWLHALRNDPRARAVLDRAQALRERHRLRDEVLGPLEQVWGEYWQRSNDLPRSLEHRHRALAIFERLEDRRSVLTTHLNLIHTYAQAGRFDRAEASARAILEASASMVLEPALLVSTHLNLGLTHFLKGAVDAAIAEYEQALALGHAAGLRLHAFRARYNLAEALYRRAAERGDDHDEARADGYVQEALASPATDASPAAFESARRLKEEILGRRVAPEPDRLLPDEAAVHAEEMTRIRREREILAMPAAAEDHARAHLAIAQAYQGIATREREAAQALVERHGLHARFAGEFERLQATFARQLTQEQRLAAHWKQAAADVLDDARRAALVRHLLAEGSIAKAAYAGLCEVSPATASKHLAELTGRGLLQQAGRGPQTRYLLPTQG